jgi:predicted phosphodiesterase
MRPSGKILVGYAALAVQTNGCPEHDTVPRTRLPHRDRERLTTSMIHFTSDAPILVFGGPYSNLQATEAMRREAGRRGIASDRIICTGDIVAYCATPRCTVDLIRDWGIQVVAGNCEQQLGADATDCACGFNDGSPCALLAKSWYEHARNQIDAERRAWMAALPATLRFSYAGHAFRVIHGGTQVVNRWVFASDAHVIREELALAKCDVVIAGHSGLPFTRRVGQQVWFNPGVIGMPANDGTPDGWYGLIAVENGRVRLATHRLAYDHRTAADDLDAEGFAPPYAEALRTGLWPSLDVMPPAERELTGKPIAEMSVSLEAKIERADSADAQAT